MALSVLLGFATVGSGIGLLATASFLIAGAALHPSVADLAIPIVGVRFFGISRGVFRYLERYVSHNVTFRLLGRLRVWFYQAVEPMVPARLMEHRSGDLLNRVVADVEALQHFYVRAIAPPLVALMTGLVMWLFVRQFDSALALILVNFLLLAGIVVPFLIHALSFNAGRDAVRLRSALSVRLVDDLQGMADLLVFGQREREIEEIGAISRNWLRAQRRMAWVTGLQGMLSTLLANAGMWAVLVAAIPLVGAGSLGGVYLPVLALAVLASFEGVSAMPLAFQQLGGSLEAGRRLLAIVDGGDGASERGGLVGAGGSAGAPAIGQGVVPTNGWPTPTPGRAGTAPRPYKSHDAEGDTQNPEPRTQNAAFVTFSSVSFRYGQAEPLAVNGVSFKLERGRRLAIVGPSGAGKSTLVNLLVRFWEYEGSITLGGRELREYDPEEARNLIAVVPQRTHLFNTTIRENLLVARPDATEEQLMRAMRQARLHSFVEKLPRGYDSWVGEQGLRLSGGERQRLAIARALLKDAPVLVLDEPASNLDSLTERDLMEMVWAGGGERAVLVITHRLASLEAADEILVMSGARVIEHGSHRHLLDTEGLYHRMWTLQNL
ncbi:MAG: amino acid ABC transporter ATP-binding/permease protein [Bacteroidetes bacterium]|nr:amino acid ABC transporter ATP-binding/permease protein [Bacteroidota bacterium]